MEIIRRLFKWTNEMPPVVLPEVYIFFQDSEVVLASSSYWNRFQGPTLPAQRFTIETNAETMASEIHRLFSFFKEEGREKEHDASLSSFLEFMKVGGFRALEKSGTK